MKNEEEPHEQTGAYFCVCDCLRAFVLTLYHAKQRGLDKADTLFVIGKKMKETLKTAIFR